jgi:peptide/nickel transport system ATP-binding protein
MPEDQKRGRRPVLEVDDLTVDLPTEDGTVHAVRGVTLSVDEGEVLGVVGESGCGKSVTMLGVMGLLPSSARLHGGIRLRGEDIAGLSGKRRRSLAGRRIAMIFQDPMTALNPVYPVGEQIAEALQAHQPVSRAVAFDRAAEMLDLVGIPSPRRRLASYPHELSGGMRQRVMIALAVVNNPDVIIADEPTTALDVTVQAQILETLLQVRDAVRAAIVLITHDFSVLSGVAGRAMVMYAGRIVETGATSDLLTAPRMPYTAGLLGAVPPLDVRVERLCPIPGAPPSLRALPSGCPFAPRCPVATERCREQEPELLATDRAVHRSACHHWTRLVSMEDPSALFTPGEGGR